MLLDDLKNFIIGKGVVEENSVFFDYDNSGGKNVVVLWNNGSVPCDLARRSSVQFCVKNTDLEASRLICEEIYKTFYPDETFQKSMMISGKIMHIKVLKEPYYLEKDASGRHCSVFVLLFTYSE